MCDNNTTDIFPKKVEFSVKTGRAQERALLLFRFFFLESADALAVASNGLSFPFPPLVATRFSVWRRRSLKLPFSVWTTEVHQSYSAMGVGKSALLQRKEGWKNGYGVVRNSVTKEGRKGCFGVSLLLLFPLFQLTMPARAAAAWVGVREISV